MFSDFKRIIEETRVSAKSLIGKQISYKHGGHDMTGEVLDVHPFTPQVKVESKTGKQYWIWWTSIKEQGDV